MSAPWKQKASSGGNFDSDIPEADNHPAVCVAIIDLGSTTETYKDKEKGTSKTATVRKIYIAWELTASRMSGTKANHVIGNRYTLSLNEKATLGKMIGQWRGKPLEKDEEFDISKLLGKPCLLNVTHFKGEKRTYANVGTVTRLPKGMNCPAALHTPVIWAIGEGPIPAEVGQWVPEYVYGEKLVDIIQGSPEWKAHIAQREADQVFGSGGAPPAAEEEEEQPAAASADSDIPF